MKVMYLFERFSMSTYTLKKVPEVVSYVCYNMNLFCCTLIRVEVKKATFRGPEAI